MNTNDDAVRDMVGNTITPGDTVLLTHLSTPDHPCTGEVIMLCRGCPHVPQAAATVDVAIEMKDRGETWYIKPKLLVRLPKPDQSSKSNDRTMASPKSVGETA